ncbi:MAG: DUF4349 domain-containing protein [Planctomycetales bacterium]
MKIPCLLLVLAAVVNGSGCGVQSARESARRPSSADETARVDDVGGREGKDDALPAEGQAGAVGEPGRLERKIIYNATLNLVVEDFSPLPEEVQQLVARHGGYVAGSELSGAHGARRRGQWTIRVPVAKFGDFLDEAAALGELRSRSTDSQEVTAEYYDVESRIRNKQKEEARLLEHLESSTGKLEDILAVERELSRVREELERLQGRMRVLNDLTALSTLTLIVEEIRDYVPPEAATFGTRIARTFDGSLAALVEFAQALVLLLVAIGPWLVVLMVPLLFAIVILRRLLRARKRPVKSTG